MNQKRIRICYSSAENLKMQIYVKNHPGNPNNVSYWEIAKFNRLFDGHSADSLRAHWRIIGDKILQQPCKVNLKVVKETIHEDFDDSIEYTTDSEDLNEKKKAEKVFQTERANKLHLQQRKMAQSFTNVVKQKKKSKGSVLDPNEIDELFSNLCAICRTVSSFSPSPEQVLEILIRHNGSVPDTIKFFNI